MYERKLNRLNKYDYSRCGYYYVTICANRHIKWFGNIANGVMVLNKYGEIVNAQWRWLATQYPYVALDKYVIMPDHFHGIIGINTMQGDNVIVGNGRDHSLRKIKPLPELMGAFKTTSSKSIHIAGGVNFRWQKSFYDHIIRDEYSLRKIREYIVDNPARWNMDFKNDNVRNGRDHSKC